MFHFFVDDDIGGQISSEVQMKFLHEHYFPRIAFGSITLSAPKCSFFVTELEGLGIQGGVGGLRPSADKIAKIRDYPTPTNGKEVDAFLYMTIYLRKWIPGRADHARIMKSTSKYVEGVESIRVRGKREMVRKKVKKEVEFEWSKEADVSFKEVKKSIVERVIWGGDEELQYHLSVDVSNHGLGGVLFQLSGGKPGEVAGKSNRGREKVVMFISQRFEEAEQRYALLERECLAILRCLEESRWLVVGSKYPVKIYTNKIAMGKVIRGEIGVTNRTAGWQMRMSEYDLQVHHVGRNKELRIAEGLSRMGVKWMDDPPGVKPAWEDVCGIETSNEQQEEESTREGYGDRHEGIEARSGGESETEWVELREKQEVMSRKRINEQHGTSESELEPMRETEVEEALDKWSNWLEDKWYGEVVNYRITGRMPAGLEGNERRRRWMRMKARPFLLVEHPTGVRPGYRRKGVGIVWCLKKSELPNVMRRYHDLHGHYSEGILTQKLVKKFYWPSMHKDVREYCRTCEACQRLGPLKSLGIGIRPILSLQPMDLWGLDFIGPITPLAEGSKARYIILGTDYFSRFTVGEPRITNNGRDATEFVKERISKPYGWPGSMYTNNGSHFVKGELPGVLHENGVLHMKAPIRRPSSAGMIERYVQLVVAGLRGVLQNVPGVIEKWDLYVQGIICAMNSRILRVYGGYTPSQLFLGFEARFDNMDLTVRDVIIRDRLLERVEEGIDGMEFVGRMSEIEERRGEATEARLKEQDKWVERKEKREEREVKVGDLVLLRKHELDKQKGRKLEPRWDGPFKVKRVTGKGMSAELEDLIAGKMKGRYHLGDMKPYLQREEGKWGKGKEIWGVNGVLKELEGKWVPGQRELNLFDLM